MKKLAVFFLFLAALHARADFVITEKVEVSGEIQNLIIKIKGDKIRTDVGAIMSDITDLTTGDLIQLSHPDKKFRKTVPAKQPVTDNGGKTPEKTPEPPKITDTGRQEKAGGFTAEIYTAEGMSGKYTFWVVKDWPNAAAVQAALCKPRLIQEKSSQGFEVAPDISKLDGVLVKVTLDGTGEKYTLTLVSAVEQAVDGSEFEVPAGYEDATRPAQPADPNPAP